MSTGGGEATALVEGEHRTQQPAPSGTRLAPLDGIRAFAVLAVLLYHGGVSWVNGGLLGVDVFFVLSGFLITSLLCREYLRRSTIALKSFWARRARRLLPALFVLLVGVAVYARVYAGSIDLPSLRGDAISTLLYVANWRFIFSDQGYFAQAAAPSPLLHMWSLGVEEQYYLIWPLVALFVLRRFGTRGLAWTAGVGAVASAVLMAAMFHTGFSIDRLYYGTDTRAQALLVGSFLGAISAHRNWHVIPARWADPPAGRWAGRLLGLFGAAYLLWAWHIYNGQATFLYNGGFLIVAVAAGAVITTVTTWPTSLLAKACSFSVLTYIGRISYGLYVYHWPLFLVINNAHTGLTGTPLLLVRLAVTGAISVVSYHFIELPIRRAEFFHHRRGLVATGGVVIAMAVVLIVATVTPTSARVTVNAASAIPAAEHQQLAAANAFTTNPVRFELFGDSIALTLGNGLAINSKRDFGIKLYKAYVIGCDLDPGLDIRNAGQVTIAPQTCLDWPQRISALVNQDRPEVFGVLLGRWESYDHLYQGHWVHLGEPVWDNHIASQLNEVVRIGSSKGAKVALFTMPYVDLSQEAPNGQPYPENQPSRVTAYNAIVERVAKEHPGLVTVIDLNKMLDPNGHYTSTIDGIVVRWTDGIHISSAGDQWLQPKILPQIASLGLSSRAAQLDGPR